MKGDFRLCFTHSAGLNNFVLFHFDLGICFLLRHCCVTPLYRKSLRIFFYILPKKTFQELSNIDIDLVHTFDQLGCHKPIKSSS